jgi:hypothetical protein
MAGRLLVAWAQARSPESLATWSGVALGRSRPGVRTNGERPFRRSRRDRDGNTGLATAPIVRVATMELIAISSISRKACEKAPASAIRIWRDRMDEKDAPHRRLLQEAKAASGAKTDTDTVRPGLEALVRHAAYQRLSTLRGAESPARAVPRRRERALSTRHSV